MLRLSSALLALLLLTPFPRALAQEATDPAAEPETPPLVQEGIDLGIELDEGKVRVDELSAQLKSAAGEDRAVLERASAEQKMDLLATLQRLVASFQQQEAAALDTGLLRSRLRRELRRLAPVLREHLDESKTGLADMRAERESSEGTKLLSLEERIAQESAWRQILFEAYSDQMQNMRAVDLDTSREETDYNRRLELHADLVSGRLALATRALELSERQSAASPGDVELQTGLQAQRVRKKTLVDSLTSTTGLLDENGLSSSLYRQRLIRATGEVSFDVFRFEVLSGLVRGWWRETGAWLSSNGRRLISQAFVFVLVLGFSWLVAGVVRRMVSRALSRSETNVSQLLRSMLLGMTSRIVLAVGLLIALSQIGIQLGPLLAGLGVAGFIVGFALQDSLSNFASGVMILGYRPYDVDDFIEAAGVFGRVSHMSLVSTTIMTIDNQTLIVPNSKIWGDVIKNITNQRQRRVDMTFRISYADDLDRAEQVLAAILEDHEKVLAQPEPMIRVHELNENGIDIIVRPWVETGDYWDVYWDVTREVKRRLDQAGIHIAAQRQEIRVLSGRGEVR